MDNIVDVIFTEDFSLTDGMESDLVCGDGIQSQVRFQTSNWIAFTDNELLALLTKQPPNQINIYTHTY